jgi:D-sedoheptulose 7-phosphate isomerase
MAENRDGYAARVEEIFRESSEVHARAARALPEGIARAAALVVDALRSGSKVLLCGNGGSAADAQHIAAELAGRLRRERAGLPAVALTVNPSVLTAVSNDYGYQAVFARQVEALGREGDVLIGISTSGGSANVVEALAEAGRRGMVTIGLVGEGGGPMKEHCDVAIHAPSSDTQRVQEIHIVIGHAICEIVESELFGTSARKVGDV